MTAFTQQASEWPPQALPSAWEERTTGCVSYKESGKKTGQSRVLTEPNLRKHIATTPGSTHRHELALLPPRALPLPSSLCSLNLVTACIYLFLTTWPKA